MRRIGRFFLARRGDKRFFLTLSYSEAHIHTHKQKRELTAPPEKSNSLVCETLESKYFNAGGGARRSLFIYIQIVTITPARWHAVMKTINFSIMQHASPSPPWDENTPRSQWTTPLPELAGISGSQRGIIPASAAYAKEHPGGWFSWILVTLGGGLCEFWGSIPTNED